MFEDFIVGLIKLSWFVIKIAVLVALLFVGIGCILSSTITSWWYTIPGGIALLWAFAKWVAMVVTGEFDPEVLPISSLIKVLVLFGLAAGAFVVFSLTTATTWWFTIPGGLILGVLAFLWFFGVFDGYLPGVHPDEFSQGPGMRD